MADGVAEAAAPAGSAPPRIRLLGLLGPAFVAAIAYVDPGNVAANLTAGARYGDLLVWVLVAASIMAVLIQYQSAKLGIVSGHTLPRLIGDRANRGVRIGFWIQAELVSAATDLAEVIGGAVALGLLFHLPLPIGGLIVGAVAMGVLGLQSRGGQRRFEAVIFGLLAVISIGFVAGLFVSDVDWGAAVAGLVPRFDGTESVVLAAGMLGATVMPHAIYLHSALARDRHGAHTDVPTIRRLLHATRIDVGAALVIAGAVNIAMLLLAANALHGAADTGILEGAHAVITADLGQGIGVVFAIGLLASGLASASVGSYAGAVVMAGLLRFRVPLLVRRGVTLVPAIVLLTVGVSPTGALIASQVLLSIGIPFAVVPLVTLTSDRRVMGAFASGLRMRIVLWTVTGLIVTLNLVLIALTIATRV